MDSKHALSTALDMHSVQPSGTLSGPTLPKHQLAAGLRLSASTVLTASMVTAMAGFASRNGAAIFRSLRDCSVTMCAGSAFQTRGAIAETFSASILRGKYQRTFASKATGPAASASGGCGPMIRGEGRVDNGVWRRLWFQQPQPLAPHQPLALPFLRQAFSSSAATVSGAAVAASITAATAVRSAAVPVTARGGLMFRRALGNGSGLPRCRLHIRTIATQSTGASISTSSSVAAAAVAAPAGLFSRVRGRFGDAVRLQLAAVWHKYGTAVYAVTALATVFVLWRFMRNVTNTFISVNDRMAEYGIMALAASLVLLGALYLRWRTEISPASVYRQAMVRLNTHPGVLEVMGAPLVGSPVRAYVTTGGGLYLSKKFRLKLRARRIQMMFPLSGPDRRGLVSLEAKRKHGRYHWKLLAVDLGPELQQALPAGGSTGLSAAPPQPLSPPAAAPLEHSRVYVVGDMAAYQRGGVLTELRTPFLMALSNSKSYEVEDELEDELDELNVPKSLDGKDGDGVAGAVRKALTAATAAFAKPQHPAPTSSANNEPTGGDKPVSETSSSASGSGAARHSESSRTAASSTQGTGTGTWWDTLRGTVSGGSKSVDGNTK